MMAISRVTLLSIFWLTASISFWYYIKRLADDDLLGVLRLIKEWAARRNTVTWEDWVDWMGNVHIWGGTLGIGMIALQRWNMHLMFGTFLELFPFFAFMRYAELS